MRRRGEQRHRGADQVIAGRRGDGAGVVALGGRHLGPATRVCQRLLAAPCTRVSLLRPGAVVIGEDVLATLVAMYVLVERGISVVADLGPALPMGCTDGSGERRFVALGEDLERVTDRLGLQRPAANTGALSFAVQLAYAVREAKRRRGVTAALVGEGRLLAETEHCRGAAGHQLWLWLAPEASYRVSSDAAYQRLRDTTRSLIDTIAPASYDEAGVLAPRTLITAPARDVEAARLGGAVATARAARGERVRLDLAAVRRERDQDLASVIEAAEHLATASPGSDQRNTI